MVVKSDFTKPEEKSAFSRLVTLLRLVEGAWALAVIDNQSERRVSQQLRAALDPLPVIEVSFLDIGPSPLPLLRARNIPEGSAAPVIIFNAVGTAMPDLFWYIDVHREKIAKYRHRLVLLVTERERLLLLEKAPNFCSRLSGVFRFTRRPATPMPIDYRALLATLEPNPEPAL